MQEREDLSALVQRRIRDLGISNSEAARRAKLSRSYIGNIVNRTAPTQSGQYNISPETVQHLAAALEVSDAEILAAMNYLANEHGESLDVPGVGTLSFDKKIAKEDVDRMKIVYRTALETARRMIEEETNKSN